jgi:hypothetical protein
VEKQVHAHAEVGGKNDGRNFGDFGDFLPFSFRKRSCTDNTCAVGFDRLAQSFDNAGSAEVDYCLAVGKSFVQIIGDFYIEFAYTGNFTGIGTQQGVAGSFDCTGEFQIVTLGNKRDQPAAHTTGGSNYTYAYF